MKKLLKALLQPSDAKLDKLRDRVKRWQDKQALANAHSERHQARQKKFEDLLNRYHQTLAPADETALLQAEQECATSERCFRRTSGAINTSVNTVVANREAASELVDALRVIVARLQARLDAVQSREEAEMQEMVGGIIHGPPSPLRAAISERLKKLNAAIADFDNDTLTSEQLAALFQTHHALVEGDN